MLRRDKDIEVFRNMLDFVWYEDDVSLKNVINILSSAVALNKAITAKEKMLEVKQYGAFLNTLPLSVSFVNCCNQ